jgi:NAD(P)H-hydrate epimerase
VINLKTAVLDVRRMDQADSLTVAAGASIAELMENAGHAVAREIETRWSIRPVTVLCGPGNNGGDGFVAARRLAEAGWPVRVALLGAREHLKGAACRNAERWQGPIEPVSPDAVAGAALVIDALFGSGLTRPLEGIVERTLSVAGHGGTPIIAVDVPSGLMGDTGEAMGAVAAVLTVTFLRKKPGHLLMPGRLLCGEVVVADIGTPTVVLDDVCPDLFENDPALWLSALPRLAPDGSKYTRGHALIVGGYPMTGAARMAARAAARMGAGLTTIAVPDVALPIYAAALTSIMVHPLAAPGDFDTMLEDHRLSAFLIGPGATATEETRQRVFALLRTSRPTVIDAGALTAFAHDPASLEAAIFGPCVLTPHEGEFHRLFDATGDKLSRARAAARLCGAIIVLKGADTVIAAPDGRAVINTDAPPTLATAGSGDVLAGMVLGLLAQGMEPFLAAAAAVWLHGAAATAFGPCLLAEDLSDQFPALFRSLQN